MFMVTVHKGSLRRFAAMLGCAAVLCAVLLGINSLADGARATAAAAAGDTVKSAEDMANYLLGYGVEVDVGTAQVLQVTIPKKFDKSFQAFNEVIQDSGMDLAKYKGKLAEKWVLQSPNRTVENQTAYAVLLVRNSKVIGGYLLYQPSGEVISLRATLDIQTLLPQTESADAMETAGLPAAETAAAPDAAAETAAGSAVDAAVETTAEEAVETAVYDAAPECAADPGQPAAAQDPMGDSPVTAEQEAPAAETAAEAQGEQADIYPIE